MSTSRRPESWVLVVVARMMFFSAPQTEGDPKTPDNMTAVHIIKHMPVILFIATDGLLNRFILKHNTIKIHLRNKKYKLKSNINNY